MAKKIKPSRCIIAEKNKAEGKRKIHKISGIPDWGNTRTKNLYSAAQPKKTMKLKNNELIQKSLKLKKSNIETIFTIRIVRKLFQKE